MMFSHGAWRWKEGVVPAFARRVFDHRIDGDRLWIAGLDRHGREGVDRFEGLVLQISVTSPMPDVIRVRVQHHHRPANISGASLDLDYSLAASGVSIEEHEDHLLFTSGRLSLRVGRNRWEMRFLDGDAHITGGGQDSLAYMQAAGSGCHLMQRLSMGVGECIYGLGERFGPLVKNGQSIAIWNEDCGTVSDLAYKNIPFYLSSRGYGVLVNTPAKVEFEIGTERVSQVQFSVPGEELDYYVFYGPDPKHVLHNYARLCGRPAVPPAWSFGLWLSTSFTTRYDEKTVNEFVDGMSQRGIPLSVFHFDCFWMKERQWCDFEWDAQAFPDPAGMLRRLKGKGLRICVWINPYISQLSKLFREGCDKGCFLRRPDGAVFQRDAWQPGMALVDFTNPAAVEWYCGKLRRLLEMGVDCFKTDFGEFIPEEVVYHDGSDPRSMHNHYAYLYNKAVFELLESFHGKGNAMVFARSAAAGSQKFPVHWGGDCEATWESMAEELRGGLSFCLSGAAFWSHDIGGFAGKPNPPLYKRWAAWGLLSSHSRLHGSESYRVPWFFDEESVGVMRRFSRLKNALFPYLFSLAHEANARGLPLMRAMVLEFPQDPACLYLDQQYMLGPALLVAPVFRQDNVVEYYLPPGRWTDLLTGQAADGGRWRRAEPDFMHLPLLVRENTLLPISGNEQRPEWRFDDELTLHAFQIADGAQVNVPVFSTEGERPAHFRCVREGARLTFDGDGRARNVRVLLRSSGAAGQINNGRILRQTPEEVLVQWRDPGRPMTLEIEQDEEPA